MNKIETFEKFLTTYSANISSIEFLINFLITAALAYILSLIYIRYGSSLSNRKAFARTFVLIGVTTMIIITIVKSSLALSLGLVGALSIVRFRTAIKEPEELSYIFLVICVGLGLGADQRLITLIGFLSAITLIWLMHFKAKQENVQNLYLTVLSESPEKIPLESIIKILKEHCEKVDIKRFDEGQTLLESSFLIEFTDFSKLNNVKLKLKELDKSVKISFLDNMIA